MPLLIGMLIGSIIAVYLLSALIEWAFIKRVMDDQTIGGLSSTAIAVVVAIIIYGFGNANGGSWNPLPGGIFYIIGGCIVAVIRRWRLRDRPLENEDELRDTFE
jgi:hypothetical protein